MVDDASVFEKAADMVLAAVAPQPADSILEVAVAPPAAAAPAAQARPAAAGVAKQCARCGTCAGKLRRCGRCKGPHYCSVDCQRVDWRRHQRVCRVPP